jgi:hypothetical protein
MGPSFLKDRCLSESFADAKTAAKRPTFNRARKML